MSTACGGSDAGGAVEVWRGRLDGVDVAVKPPRRARPIRRRSPRSSDEAATQSRVSHPHVLPLVAVLADPDPGAPALVTRWARGGTLEAALDDTPPTVSPGPWGRRPCWWPPSQRRSRPCTPPARPTATWPPATCCSAKQGARSLPTSGPRSPSPRPPWATIGPRSRRSVARCSTARWRVVPAPPRRWSWKACSTPWRPATRPRSDRGPTRCGGQSRGPRASVRRRGSTPTRHRVVAARSSGDRVRPGPPRPRRPRCPAGRHGWWRRPGSPWPCAWRSASPLCGPDRVDTPAHRSVTRTPTCSAPAARRRSRGPVRCSPWSAASGAGVERFHLGRPGDRLLLGRWACAPLVTPALYRPATGGGARLPLAAGCPRAGARGRAAPHGVGSRGR